MSFSLGFKLAYLIIIMETLTYSLNAHIFTCLCVLEVMKKILNEVLECV